ncbi:citrate synthase [Devosia sp. 2618]|uniref:citrate synthase n=1 Tax=Devosia sp. 2618 TaxID=3156454 RepID=UPI00339A4E7D
MDWMTANEALTLLGTQPQTLYANVSRGRIKAKPDPADSRRSLYRGDDVRRLAQRGAGRRKQETIAAEAIRWGEPVLTSSISTIVDAHLLYRGHDAAELAETYTLEHLAGLLWETSAVELRDGPIEGPGSIRAGLVALAERAATDWTTLGRSESVLKTEANSVLSTVSMALIGAHSETGPLHIRLASAWDCPDATDLLRRTLVLLADHELNASTFAARVTASTGASLAAATLSGLAALTGPLHGRASIAALQLSEEAKTLGAEAAVLARLGQGRHITAFGHQLYDDGDARANALFDHFEMPQHFAELRAAAERITGARANIDFALAAITRAHNLPEDAPMILFALGRSVGWLAHALEQVTSGELIRPRARYVGD